MNEFEDGDEYGIPTKLKVKRPYTLSEAALAQRRANAQKASEAGAVSATGPTTPEGKKTVSFNAWKTGQYAQTLIRRHRKPCLSTCPNFNDCSMIETGKAAPGMECQDKENLVETFNIIRNAIESGDLTDLKEILSMLLAKQTHIIADVMDGILQDGAEIILDKYDKDGNVIGHDLKPHPGLLSLSKLMGEAGITFKDMMATPKEITKAGREKDGIKTIADLMSSIANPKKSDA
jgi:hypothetical protein